MRTGLIAMLAAACLMSAAPSFGADERNITIYNATGYGINSSASIRPTTTTSTRTS